MKVSITNRDILKIAAPISLSLLIPQINFSTNNYFLGRVGELELAVNGIAGVFYLMLASIGMGLGNGMQIQMSRRAGEGNHLGVAKIFTNGAMMAVALALGLMMLTLWFAPLVFGFNLHDDRTIFYSINFLYIRVWGLPFMMLTQMANAFYIATGQSKVLIFNSIAGTGVNILFDYLLIQGHWGFHPLGIEGAAIASVLAEISGCLMAFGIFFASGMYRKFPFLGYLQFDLALSKKSLRTASPLIVQYLFSIGGWLIFYFYVEHLGTRELAASNLLRTVFGIVGIGSFAFAATTSTMVSNIIAQGKSNSVIHLVRKICKLSLGFAVIISILLLTFSYPFLYFYRPDPDLVNFTIPSLRIICVAILMMSVSTVMFNAVVGTGNTLFNLGMEIFCVSMYLVYCYIFIQRLRMPLYVAWLSEFVYWTSLITISYLYLRSGKWRGKVI